MLYRKKTVACKPAKGLRVKEPLHRNIVLLLNASMHGAVRPQIVYCIIL